MQLYSFKMNKPNSVSHKDMEWCPGLPTPDLRRVHHKLNFLFLLGAQKSGTTWLHKALFTHRLFVEANTAYLCVLQHFFIICFAMHVCL